MDGEQLLDALEDSRVRLLQAIVPLTDEQLLVPDVVAHTSLRDALLVITLWEAELITGLSKIDTSNKPVRLLEALADPVGFEENVLARHQERDLDRIFSDLEGVYVQLEGWLEELDDAALLEKRRPPWPEGQSLGEVIWQCSVDKEMRFLPQIEAYSRQCQSSSTMISSNDIELLGNDDE